MEEQTKKIEETLKNPEEVRESSKDPSVRLYYKRYKKTPVTEKYLVVVAKVGIKAPFIITSFFTDRIKSGRPVEKRYWQSKF